MGRSTQARHFTVHVKDSDMFVTVQLLEDTPRVLPLGKSFEENGKPYEWKEGQTSLKNHDIIFLYKCDNFVPIVVPDLSSGTNISDSAGNSTEDTKE